MADEAKRIAALEANLKTTRAEIAELRAFLGTQVGDKARTKLPKAKLPKAKKLK